MSELLKIAPRPPAQPRKSAKPRTYVRLTIRSLVADAGVEDESCIVIGAPGSFRLRENLKAFRQRYPTDQYAFIQS